MKRKPTSNELLYAHVTRVGFDLTLGRTHIAALVYADMSIRFNQTWHRSAVPSLARPFNHFASGMGGLIARGLVVHHYNEAAERKSLHSGTGGLKPHYTITTAGQLVIGLLKESGLYDEYAAALPVVRKAS